MKNSDKLLLSDSELIYKLIIEWPQDLGCVNTNVKQIIRLLNNIDHEDFQDLLQKDILKQLREHVVPENICQYLSILFLNKIHSISSSTPSLM
jgi:hypothetical protein